MMFHDLGVELLNLRNTVVFIALGYTNFSGIGASAIENIASDLLLLIFMSLNKLHLR